MHRLSGLKPSFSVGKLITFNQGEKSSEYHSTVLEAWCSLAIPSWNMFLLYCSFSGMFFKSDISNSLPIQCKMLDSCIFMSKLKGKTEDMRR